MVYWYRIPFLSEAVEASLGYFFKKLVDETQISKPLEPTMNHNSMKWLILLPIRAELLFTLQYEIPCNIFANLAQCNPVKISLGYLSQIFPVCLGLVLLRKSRLEKKKRKTNFLWSFLSKPKKILSVNHWRYFHVYLREYLFVYDWGSPSSSVALKDNTGPSEPWGFFFSLKVV